MARTYYLALVDAEDTTFSEDFARHDETVFSFTVSQQEGDFCSLSVVIENPSVALLDDSRPQWAWLSMDEDGEITPLFHGRIVGVPADLQKDLVTVEFLAKPVDFEDQKRTVAATLREAPFWDYAFIDPQMWDDADATLEARTDVWHINRTTNAVAISSIISGEDGTLDIPADLIPDGEFSLSYNDAPLRKVNLEMRALWTQDVKGSLNITPELLAAFAAAGSPDGYVTTFTGQGLYDDWPMDGDNLSNVYSFGPQKINVADGKALGKQYKNVKVKYDRAPTSTTETVAKRKHKVKFRRWGFFIDSIVNYDATIDRTEDILFTVYADVQDMVNGTEDEQSETITLSSGALGSEVGVGSAVEVPIGDSSRDQFWPTPRGLAAIEYGLSHARALLLRRARAAQITVTVPIGTAIQASCRKSATVHHPELPGGAATGKIVGYNFGVDGSTGEEGGQITIACLVGKDTDFAAVDGTPDWADADYVGADWQHFTGRIAYNEGIGVNYALPAWTDHQPAVIGVQSVSVLNGETTQSMVLDARFLDIDAACDALNGYCTEVDLHMIPLDTSPRELRYSDSIVNLSIPLGINLGGV
ncbi:MAG: hypothetical protein WAP47_08845 [Candidatus Rokuibacteriota bacterium]